MMESYREVRSSYYVYNPTTSCESLDQPEGTLMCCSTRPPIVAVVVCRLTISYPEPNSAMLAVLMVVVVVVVMLEMMLMLILGTQISAYGYG